MTAHEQRRRGLYRGADSPLAMDGLNFGATAQSLGRFRGARLRCSRIRPGNGNKVKNGTISLAESGDALRTILELAHEEGRATGL